MASGNCSNGFRRTLGDNVSAAGPAFRSQIHHPVRGLDHIQEHPHIPEVQAGCGFVQDIQGVAGIPFGQFPGQFDALGFPPPPDRVKDGSPGP
jgi:hypothetical protein